MRILHTSDWHLGKRLDDFSRLDEQREVLNEIIEIANEQDVDAVLFKWLYVLSQYGKNLFFDDFFFYFISLSFKVFIYRKSFFTEGFCWTDVNSTFLKARIKMRGIFDVLSMSLFTRTQLPDWYYVCLINTDFTRWRN